MTRANLFGVVADKALHDPHQYGSKQAPTSDNFSLVGTGKVSHEDARTKSSGSKQYPKTDMRHWRDRLFKRSDDDWHVQVAYASRQERAPRRQFQKSAHLGTGSKKRGVVCPPMARAYTRQPRNNVVGSLKPIATERSPGQFSSGTQSKESIHRRHRVPV